MRGVTSVTQQAGGQFMVSAAAGANPAPDVAEMVVGRGWPLLELVPVRLTLEDIFLQLTAEDATAAEGETEPEESEDDA